MNSLLTSFSTALTLMTMATAAICQENTLYVSPTGNDTASGTHPDQAFATLTRARDAIRDLKQGDGPAAAFTVYLREGIHRLSKPLVLEPGDSGAPGQPVTWAAYPGERPVISGARAITDWHVNEDGLWIAQLPSVANGEWNFKTLYVDGKPSQRPRVPSQGYYRIASFPNADEPPWAAPGDHFTFSAGDIHSDWRNLTDVEVVALRFWVSSRQPIATVDESANTVHFGSQTRYRYSDDFGDEGARYYIENVYEALSEGQWYLDRPAGQLVYHPMPGQDLATTRFEAPVAPQLVRFEGEPEKGAFVTDIHFRDIWFQHNNWMLPEGDAGDGQSSPTVAGALYLKGAVGCAIEGCRLVQLSSYAIQIDAGCRNNRLVGNELANLGGGGLRMGGGDATSHPDLRTGSNLITDNHIHHIGQIFHAATGIWIQHSGGNTISHNEIDHTYYSSIAIGWVWGYAPSVTTHNEISYNHLHHVGQGVLSDMGGIYMLGVAPGTIVRNNLIHDIESHGYGGWGIYTDEGSSHVLIENNIVHHTKCASFDQHYGRQNIVRNNIFALGREDAIHRSRAEEHISFFVERNIIYWAGDTPVLGGEWGEKSYLHRPGKPWVDPETTSVTQVFDYNLYFNPDKDPAEIRFDEWTLEEWQTRGQDTHSIFANPGFIDPEAGDFGLAADSPAFSLGFRPIDMTNVGPRRSPGE